MSRVFVAAQQGADQTYLNTPASAVYNVLPAITIAAWVKPATLAFAGTIAVKDPNNIYSPYLAFNQDTGEIISYVVGTTGQALSTTNEAISVGVWSHVAATFNIAGDKKVHIFINGVEATYSSQTAITGSVENDSADGYYFGSDTFGDGWDGSIAEIAIWNKALSQPDITTLAASTTGAAAVSPANLVGYWHLCGTASPEPDSINGNDAVVNGNPLPAAGPNSPGYSGCAGGSMYYSAPDCRNYGQFPNNSVDVQGTTTYTVPAHPSHADPADSRTAGAPVDSRIAAIIPFNNRNIDSYVH